MSGAAATARSLAGGGQAGLELHRQRLLSDQTKVLLGVQGFQESVGYDNRGHTRLLGTIPASSLPRLLDDLRVQTGWLAPAGIAG